MKESMFKYDFYRMTGHEYANSFSDKKLMMRQHNLRYVKCWRTITEGNRSIFQLVKLFRLSRKFGLEISLDAKIGKGLYVGHPYNITVAGGSVIGDNVNIHKGCTIGRENRGKREGTPVIGNQVFLGINATIIGNVKIGNDVMIAPNSFINFDVPDHSIVVGNPGKIIPKEYATEGYVGFLVE